MTIRHHIDDDIIVIIDFFNFTCILASLTVGHCGYALTLFWLHVSTLVF